MGISSTAFIEERAGLLNELADMVETRRVIRQKLAQLERLIVLYDSGSTDPAPTSRRTHRSPDPTTCPTCGKRYIGIGAHRARAHGYRAGDD